MTAISSVRASMAFILKQMKKVEAFKVLSVGARWSDVGCTQQSLERIGAKSSNEG